MRHRLSGHLRFRTIHHKSKFQHAHSMFFSVLTWISPSLNLARSSNVTSKTNLSSFSSFSLPFVQSPLCFFILAFLTITFVLCVAWSLQRQTFLWLFHVDTAGTPIVLTQTKSFVMIRAVTRSTSFSYQRLADTNVFPLITRLLVLYTWLSVYL